MKEFLSIEKILSLAKTDIDDKIKRNLFTGDEGITNDNEENFYTIEALYCQWAEDEDKAIDAIWEMFEKDYSNYLN